MTQTRVVPEDTPETEQRSLVLVIVLQLRYALRNLPQEKFKEAAVHHRSQGQLGVVVEAQAERLEQVLAVHIAFRLGALLNQIVHEVREKAVKVLSSFVGKEQALRHEGGADSVRIVIPILVSTLGHFNVANLSLEKRDRRQNSLEG